MLYQGRPFSGHERNCCFLNTRGGGLDGDRFATISAVSGLDFDDDGRALVQVDWDQDGDLDLWISNRNAPRLRFLRNEIPLSNQFVQLKLVGNGTDTNRNGVGARVTLTTREPNPSSPPIIKTLRAGEGFLSQSSSWLHFGLGPTGEIARIVVQWPNQNHQIEEFSPVPVNGRYVLVQGSGVPRPVAARTGALALAPAPTEVPPADPQQRIPLIYPLSVPALGYFGFDGSSHDIVLDKNQVTLINLWSANCKPCLAELKEFTRRAGELKSAGVRVIALSIDGLESGAADGNAAAKGMAKQIGIPFEVGMAPPAVIEDLRQLHDILITVNRPLPMPSSFLINRQGELEAIYKGMIDIDTLLADARVDNIDVLARFERAAAFPGTMLDDEVVNSAMIKNQAMVHYKLAKQLVADHQIDEAAKEYDILLQYLPEAGSIINDRAVLWMMKGNLDEAAKLLARAMSLKPTDPEIRFNLARTREMQGRLAEATELMEAAVAEFPEHANSHFLLGVLRIRGRDFAGGKASLERANICNPRHDRARFALANLLVAQGEFAAAKRHLQVAVDVSPNEPVILLALGKIEMHDSNWAEAESLFRSATRGQPPMAESHFQLGLALAAQSRLSEARRALESARKLDAKFPGLNEALEQLTHANVSTR